MKKREQIKKEVASMNDKIQAGVESSLNQIGAKNEDIV